MKKFIIIICSLLVAFITISFVKYYDLSDAQKYTLRNDGVETSVLTFDKESGISMERLNELSLIVNANNALLTKSVYFDDYIAVYTSDQTFVELAQRLSNDGIEVKSNSCQVSESCYFASYETGEETQLDYSKDFLDNQRYRYYLLKDIDVSGGIIFGNYFLTTENISQIENELGDYVSGVKSVPLISGGDMRQKDTANLMLSVSFISIGMLFIAMIFALTNDSPKIAIAKLNGLSSKDIHQLVKPPLKRIVLSVSFFSYLVLVLNATYIHADFSKLYLGLILTLTLVLEIVSLVATKLIVSRIKASSAIKNESYTGLLFSVNTVVKIVVMASLLVLFTSLSYESIDYIKTQKSINAYSNIFDLAVFQSSYGEMEDEDVFFDNLLSFYKDVSSRFVTITSQFEDLMYKYNPDKYFESYSLEERKREEDLRKSMNAFGFARVDKNFLMREGVVLFDPQGNAVDISIDYDENIILLPKSDVHLWEDVKASLIENSSFSHAYLSYFKRQITTDTYQYFYYENRYIQSNLPAISADGKIDSPWMYLESPNNVFTFQYPGGLGIAAMGINTNVKFVVPEDVTRVELYQRLSPYLMKHDLFEHLPLSYFLTIEEMIGQPAKQANEQLGIIWGFFIIGFTLNILLMLQSIRLYFIRNSKDIAVKKMLGYKVLDIFKTSISNSAQIFMMSALIAMLFMTVKGQKIGIVGVTTILCMSVFELLINFLFSYREFNQLTSSTLKGGDS